MSAPQHLAFEEDVSAAAVLFAGFIALFLLLWLVAPPTAAHLAASDPLIQWVEAHLGIGAIPVLAALPVFAWVSWAPPSREALRRAAVGAALAAGLVGLGLPLLRLAVGPALPAFVPPEESAAPGLLLGVGAGVIEEGVFRLGLLGATLGVARRFLPQRKAAILAVAGTALAFALAHELGPGAGPFDARYFLSRFAIPGCVMGALFVRPGPAFAVSLHCFAHVLIPVLFTGAAAT